MQKTATCIGRQMQVKIPKAIGASPLAQLVFFSIQNRIALDATGNHTDKYMVKEPFMLIGQHSFNMLHTLYTLVWLHLQCIYSQVLKAISSN